MRTAITHLLLRAVPLALALTVSPAQAMSYVMPSDEALLDGADAVVEGEITAVSADAADPLDATHYELRVDGVLKGQVGATVGVRVPGAQDPQRPGALIVPGAPRFAGADRVVAFLHARDDGSFELAQLSVGVFHVQRTLAGEDILERDLADAHELGSDPENAEHVRKLAGFKAWARAREAGGSGDAAYWTTVAPSDFPATPKFRLEQLPAVRWFDFDSARNVVMYAGDRGQAGLPGGGYAEFQQALAAWDSDPTSHVRLAYGGVTGASGGANRADGVNAILFNDPNGSIPGTYSCAGGGIVAYTSYRFGTSLLHGGVLFQTLSEADIVVQDGAGCVLAAPGAAAEVFGHEIGHALGLDHPCGDPGLAACTPGSPTDNALMRPFMHGGGRGAALQTDDRAGIATLYPEAGAPPPTEPPPNPAPAGADSGGGGGGGALGASSLLLLFGLRGLRRVRRIME